MSTPSPISLRERAVRASVAVAAAHGVTVGEPVILADRANLVVRLAPAPIVARVATTTALVRGAAGTEASMAREVALARHARARGAAVVTPADDILPAGPHRHDGLVLTFWSHVEAVPGTALPDLRTLHAALADYTGPPALPVLAPLAEIPGFVARLSLADADRVLLLATHARLDGALRAHSAAFQPLHGDAHAHNVLHDTAGRALWTDFEDCCLGPREWDLACLTRRATPAERATYLAAYAAPVDGERLELCLRARFLQAVTWVAVLATRYPEERARAEAYLAELRATS